MYTLAIIVYFIYHRYLGKKMNNEAQTKVISEGFENYFKNLNNEELLNSYKTLIKEYRKLYREPKANMIKTKMESLEIAFKLDFALSAFKERGIKEPDVEEE